jgi:hypothetical protein
LALKFCREFRNFSDFLLLNFVVMTFLASSDSFNRISSAAIVWLLLVDEA